MIKTFEILLKAVCCSVFETDLCVSVAWISEKKIKVSHLIVQLKSLKFNSQSGHINILKIAFDDGLAEHSKIREAWWVK